MSLFSRFFLNTHKLVLLLQLYPGAENNLKYALYHKHLTLVRDKMEQYEF